MVARVCAMGSALWKCIATTHESEACGFRGQHAYGGLTAPRARGRGHRHGRDPHPVVDFVAALGRVFAGGDRPAFLAEHSAHAARIFSRAHSRNLGHPAQMTARSNEYASVVSRARTLRRLERLARLLDSAFAIPGTRFRFGLDGVIGLAPGVGDAVGIALSSYIVVEA